MREKYEQRLCYIYDPECLEQGSDHLWGEEQEVYNLQETGAGGDCQALRGIMQNVMLKPEKISDCDIMQYQFGKSLS